MLVVKITSLYLKKSFLEKIDQNFFSLWWQSHDNFYGISAKINLLLDQGFNVVVNGSRGYYEEAIKIYPNIKTILITAQENTIRERLLQRNRENIEEIENRIKRSKHFQDKFNHKNITILSNDNELEVSGKAFVELLSKDTIIQTRKPIRQPILQIKIKVRRKACANFYKKNPLIYDQWAFRFYQVFFNKLECNQVFLRNLVQILATAFLYFLSIFSAGINFAVEKEYLPCTTSTISLFKIE